MIDPLSHPERCALPTAPYLPFLDPKTARAPGMWPLDEAAWIDMDAAYEPQMALRDCLIGAKPDEVAIARPDAAEALTEFWEVLAAHLAARRPDQFLRQKGAIRRPDGVTVIETGRIGALGRLVQEDWALLTPAPEGWRLAAANICFPSRWRLTEKIGRPLVPIHAPVPGYADALAPRVDRIFAGLRVEVPLQRLNWSVHPAPDLHQPIAAAPTARWWLRTERQTLRRLPATRAIVFGIKTSVTAVDDLAPEARAGLIAAVRAWTPDERAYKGGLEADALACPPAAETVARP